METQAQKTVAASVETVWSELANYEGMSQWAPGLSVAVQPAPGTEPNGVGAVRTIKGRLPGVPPIVEEITVFESPSRLGYRARSGVPFKNYSGEVTLAPAAEGGTTITYTLRADGRIPVIEKPVLGLITKQLLAALAGAAVKRA